MADQNNLPKIAVVRKYDWVESEFDLLLLRFAASKVAKPTIEKLARRSKRPIGKFNKPGISAPLMPGFCTKVVGFYLFSDDITIIAKM